MIGIPASLYFSLCDVCDIDVRDIDICDVHVCDIDVCDVCAAIVVAKPSVAKAANIRVTRRGKVDLILTHGGAPGRLVVKSRARLPRTLGCRRSANGSRKAMPGVAKRPPCWIATKADQGPAAMQAHLVVLWL
jgi:hypothetical protein